MIETFKIERTPEGWDVVVDKKLVRRVKVSDGVSHIHDATDPKRAPKGYASDATCLAHVVHDLLAHDGASKG